MGGPRGGYRDGMTLFLCGDVMTGRGVDQVLPHPGEPELSERSVRDARTYVRLAESAHGPIPSPVDLAWPWGDALPVLEAVRPGARIVNLETAITTHGEAALGKAVHYRMNPLNIGCLTAARPLACTLANNHVLDFGPLALTDTVAALAGAGIRSVGAGRDVHQAARPVAIPLAGGHRVLVFAAGTRSSGIPSDWAATPLRTGVHLLPDLSRGTAADVAEQVRRAKRPGDVVVFSVHWGSNWGYAVPDEQVRFAHYLVDHGVDIVHGHSSHHPRPIEIHNNRLILYGCGDFINDYEGIEGYEQYRGDLRLMYLPTLHLATGRLLRLSIVALQARRMRLQRTSTQDTMWLRSMLDRMSRPFRTRVDVTDRRTLVAVTE
jgi:poly-gamma-glutamate capsule biosynthesis protein CapA/YwtB (metallophosphatase superfamily)